ncbi:MAG: Phosphoserine phosphatase 1 [Verrucomicrobiota bacterium]|jgi:broad specificity phosphatase PhoE
MRARIPRHSTRVYFVRHGEVEARYHRIFGGSRIDMELSPLGHIHGRAVAEWFEKSALDAIYVSPMVRARQTAAPLLKAFGMEGRVREALREVDFGDWTGFGWAEVQERFGVEAYDWLEVLENGGIPNGECADRLRARVGPELERILEENAERSVAVVCHGGIVRVALALLLGQPLSHMAHFNVDYGSITAVELHPHKKHAVEIELLNFCPLTDRVGPWGRASERSLAGLTGENRV